MVDLGFSHFRYIMLIYKKNLPGNLPKLELHPLKSSCFIKNLWTTIGTTIGNLLGNVFGMELIC